MFGRLELLDYIQVFPVSVFSLVLVVVTPSSRHPSTVFDYPISLASIYTSDTLVLAPADFSHPDPR